MQISGANQDPHQKGTYTAINGKLFTTKNSPMWLLHLMIMYYRGWCCSMGFQTMVSIKLIKM